VRGRHRYGNGSATIVGADLAGETAAVLRVTFQIVARLENPIAGFLVRNEKGETVFGSNSGRENYPLPAMDAGEIHCVEFHWTMPELSRGRYFISIAVSDGTLGEFGVCDYVEDAIEFETGSLDVTGYMRLPCSGVLIDRS